MSHTIYCGKIAKRKNSTLQPTLTASFDVVLKSATSLHTPTFKYSGASFDYNYLKWGDRYYFITDVVSINNSLWDISAKLDVLATYKADILASTQFVLYSSSNSSIWLPDKRIPILASASTAYNDTSLNFLFTAGGFYVMTAVGKSGCKTYMMDSTNLAALINDISTWTDDLFDDIDNNLPVSGPVTIEDNLENLSFILNKTGVLGNAYLDAPNCIRSCIWVPFFVGDFTNGGGQCYLGEYDTGLNLYYCKTEPVSKSASVSIPWQYSDWRRKECEEVYLYLPLVGLVTIPSDEVVNESSITINWSATATDGCIAYQLVAGSQVIGTYGANAAVNYPIGISQQASAGEIVQSLGQGAMKTVAGAMMGGVSGMIGAGLTAAYSTLNTEFTKHNSCIGGIGGGAGCGLSLYARCFTVAHDTVTSPASMAATMGLPTQKPMALSTLTGYCECANAHVAATGAELSELDEIDTYLNTGFYIE